MKDRQNSITIQVKNPARHSEILVTALTAPFAEKTDCFSIEQAFFEDTELKLLSIARLFRSA
jgi:hypothetical protein